MNSGIELCEGLCDLRDRDSVREHVNSGIELCERSCDLRNRVM